MDQVCSVLDCFFFLCPLIYLFVCSPTHSSFRSYLFCQSLPQEDWPWTPSSSLCPSSPAPHPSTRTWALCSFFSCAVLSFLCIPGRRSSYYLYFILLGCLIPSPHSQPPNFPNNLRPVNSASPPEGAWVSVKTPKWPHWLDSLDLPRT